MVRLHPLRQEWSLVTLALVLLTILLVLGRWTWRLDQAIHDAAQALWVGPAPADLVLVAIDDESLRALGRWPWQRALHADVIQRVSAAGPKAILLDLLLSEPAADPQQDALLAEAIARSGKVVLPVAFDADGLRAGKALSPAPILSAPAHLGHIDAEPDPDGVLRWIYLHAGVDRPVVPQVALALLDAAGDPRPPYAALPAAAAGPSVASGEHAWHRSQRMLIRYLFDGARLPRVSFAALAQGAVPASLLADKYVLIGVTAQGLEAWNATPLSVVHGRQSPGVEIAAQILAMFKSSVELKSVPAGLNAALSSGWVLALMLTVRGGRPRRALGLAVGFAALAPLGALVLLPWGWWWAPGGALVASLTAYPLWSWRRLEATTRLLGEAVARLEAEPGPAPTLTDEAPSAEPRPRDLLERRVTAVREATRRLSAARRLLDDILAGLPAATFVVDLSWRVAQTNQAALQWVGAAKADDLVGHPLEELLANLVPSDAPSWNSLLTRVARHQVLLSTEALDTNQRSVLAHLAPLRSSASPCAGIILSLTDVTQLRLAERQREDLLAFLAHDLRSPQISLLSMVELFRMGEEAAMSPDQFIDLVDTMARNSLQLCEELLQVMRAENRALEVQPLDLVEVMASAMQEVSPQAQAKGLCLMAAPGQVEVARTLGDAYLLRRAFINLMTNAIKFSPANATVTAGVRLQNESWVCGVRDQGPGISAQDLGRLFRRYQRVERGTGSSLRPGIGLGLVFVDTVVRRHGGQVRVESEPSQGSLFELWLPAAAEPPPSASPVPADPEDVSTGASSDTLDRAG